MEQTAVSGINETQVETILETLRFHLPSQVNHRNVNKMSRRVRSCTSRWGVVCATAAFLLIGPTQAESSTGPTLDEPIHMPTMTDTSTLDVVIVEGWHVDTIDGTTRQKLINIHVDDWWEGVESGCRFVSSYLSRARWKGSSSAAPA